MGRSALASLGTTILAVQALWLWTSAARAEADARWTLSVERDPRGCITERALAARVERWLKPDITAEGVTVRVRAGHRPLVFSVVRDDEVVAERSFDVLPSRCRDRVDAVALAIALALEAAQRPPPPAEPAPPPERSTTAPRSAPPTPQPSLAIEPASPPERSTSAPRLTAPAQPLPAERAPTPEAPPEPRPVQPDARRAAATPPAMPPPPPSAPPPARVEPFVRPFELPSARPPPPVIQPEPVPVAPQRVEAEPVREAAPEPEMPLAVERTPSQLGWALQAGVGLLVGVLPQTATNPQTAFNLQAGVELGLGKSQPVRLGLEALVSSRTDLALGVGRSRTRLYAGRLLGCGHWPMGELGLEACAGLGAGAAYAEGAEYAVAKASTLGWFAVLLRAAVVYPETGRFGLRLAIDGLANAVRPRVTVEGLPNGVAAASKFGGAGSLALIVRLE